MTLLVLRLTAVGVGSVSYLLECVGSEIGLPLSDKVYKENPVLTANIYSIWVWLLPSYFHFHGLKVLIDVLLDVSSYGKRCK